jgi:hypothetical protein
MVAPEVPIEGTGAKFLLGKDLLKAVAKGHDLKQWLHSKHIIHP